MLFLLPWIFILGAYGVIPHFTVTNFEWSIGLAAITFAATCIAAWLIYVAVTGRNTFYGSDLFFEQMRGDTRRHRK